MSKKNAFSTGTTLKPGTTTGISYIARVPYPLGGLARDLGGIEDAAVPCGYRFDSRDAYDGIRRIIAAHQNGLVGVAA